MNLVLSKRKVLASACLLAGLLAFLSAGAGAQTLTPSHPPDWAQWGLNSQHTLFDGSVTGQPLSRNIVNLIYDFNVAADSQTGLVGDYNLFDKGLAANAHVGFWNSATQDTLANWQSASGQDTHGLLADPERFRRFLDPST